MASDDNVDIAEQLELIKAVNRAFAKRLNCAFYKLMAVHRMTGKRTGEAAQAAVDDLNRAFREKHL